MPLEILVNSDVQACLLVPHEHQSKLDGYHHINTHWMWRIRKRLDAALNHLYLIVYELEFIIPQDDGDDLGTCSKSSTLFVLRDDLKTSFATTAAIREQGVFTLSIEVIAFAIKRDVVPVTIGTTRGIAEFFGT